MKPIHIENTELTNGFWCINCGSELDDEDNCVNEYCDIGIDNYDG